MKHVVIRPILVAGALAIAFTSVTSAHHAWRKYHWARTTSVLTLKVGDNVDSKWDAHLSQAINDWNESVVLQLVPTPGGSSPATCAPTLGRIETCNAAYGENGWLGIAQIWITGQSHINQAVTKLNDTYFAMPTYNSAPWRQLVTCQEIAHDFGLDHQDERFNNANLGSCMDYTNDPDGGAGGASNSDPSNTKPNAHDFQQLLSIYGHTDSSNTSSSIADARAARPEAAEWGRLVRTSANNRVQVYQRDLGGGNHVITHVFWADIEADSHQH